MELYKKILLVLNFVFLFLAIFHFGLSLQKLPVLDPIEDSRIQYCFGDEELLAIEDKETTEAFGKAQLPYCISFGLLQTITTYGDSLNESNKNSNRLAMWGYLVAFTVTLLPYIKSKKWKI